MTIISKFKHSIRKLSKKKRTWGQRKNKDAKLYEIVRTKPMNRAKSGLAAITIVKDEAPYFQEWIEFHRMMGFDHFFIYDNGSTDITPKILKPYQDKNIVTLIPWQNFSGILHPQKAANAHALANFCTDFRWNAFFDVDEFLFSPTHDTLLEPLSWFEDEPCICIPWFNFGPNGHHTKPDGLVIENYTKRAHFPPSSEQRSLLRYKTILDPTQVQAAGTHAFHFHGIGPLLINERHERIPSQDVDHTLYAVSQHFQLNHYFTRSLEELKEKQYKGRVSSKGKLIPDFLNNRLQQYDTATCEDTNILKHVPILKNRLKRL